MQRLALSLLVLLAAPSAAQELHSPTATRDDAPTPVVGLGHGVAAHGGPVLVGRDWRAVFEPGRARFHPALGVAAPTTQELAFELLDVRVGDVVLATGGDEAPRREGLRVAYQRACGVVERYDATAEGLEQSFVLPARPASHGDLVVRGLLRSTMRRVATDDPSAGLAFELAGVGGVRVGAVTGIAADGTTVAGSIRCSEDVVEYVLPAAFVAEAAYPLVVDPLVATTTTLGVSPSQPDGAPDVASDGFRYFAVWDVSYAADDFDVHGVSLGPDGAPAGGVHAIRVTIGGTSRAPAVGHVRFHDAYLVAWEEGTDPALDLDVLCATVEVEDFPTFPTTNVSPAAVLAGDAGELERAPDVGGDDLDASSARAVVVYEDGPDTIHARSVRPDTATGFVAGPQTIVFFGGTYRDPCVSEGGTTGNHLIACEEWFASPAPGDHDLRWRAVDRDLNFVGPERFRTSVGPDEQNLATAGDGTVFTLAWDVLVDQSNPFAADRDVLALQVDLAGTILATRAIADDADDERDPGVAWLGDRTAVVWTDESGSSGFYDVGYTTLCDDTFELCDVESFESLAPGSVEGSPAVVGAREGASSAFTDDGMLVLVSRSNVFAADATTYARPFEAFGPWSVTNLGGGCGTSMAVLVTGHPAVGSSSFAWSIDPQSSAPAVLIMNAKGNAGPPWSCGSCALQVDTGILQVIAPVQGGFLDTFATPLPGDPGLNGLVVTTQFFALPGDSAPCPLLGPLAASDRFRFTIGL